MDPYVLESSWPRTTACVPSTGPYGMPYDHPRVTGILALTVPVNYPGAPCDLGISSYGEKMHFVLFFFHMG